MTIPEGWIIAAAGALATVIVCLWRDNLKLRAALLREKEGMIELLQEIVKETTARRDDA